MSDHYNDISIYTKLAKNITVLRIHFVRVVDTESSELYSITLVDSKLLHVALMDMLFRIRPETRTRYRC